MTVLGATGSIGLSTLEVVARHRDRYRVVALTANTAVERLLKQCDSYHPEYAVMADADGAEQLRRRLRHVDSQVQVLAGGEGLAKVAALPETHTVVAAIVGAAGLLPTLAAVRAGKRILLANKEVLVMSGRLFMEEVRQHGAQLLPLDSEHNAIFQCLPPKRDTRLAGLGVARILLTASGGPFLMTPLETLQRVTPREACAHPNWDMGRKISVDSATMMNKGLEVIEACWLFEATPEQVEVVVHPQSVVHSLVEYLDGSVLAQLGSPDMRIPIACALAWPERIVSGAAPLDLFQVARLDFVAPDTARFPCLRLAREALSRGDTATTVLNAANEVAVQAFLQEHIAFPAIASVVEEVLADVAPRAPTSLAVILEEDQRARDVAAARVARLTRRRLQ